MKPKFRKGQVVWIRGKVYNPYIYDEKIEIKDRQHIFIPVQLKNIRPNVTRKQLEEWFAGWAGYDKESALNRLCQLLGIK